MTKLKILSYNDSTQDIVLIMTQLKILSYNDSTQDIVL